MTQIHQSIITPIRANLSWKTQWESFDKGIIKCWEVGREKAATEPALSQACLNNELPTLVWKGGISSPIKGKKYGSLFYLAMWQGLRNEDLNINTEEERTLTCSKTKVSVTFTQNLTDYEVSIE